MRLAIRADASPLIGVGHVKRCLALAAAWRANGLGEVMFFTRSLGGGGEQAIGSGGYPVRILRQPGRADRPSADGPPHAAWAGVDATLDAAETVESLSAWQPDIVLVDHYAFDARWHAAVRGGTGASIVAIDDLADRDLAVDVLIDHNLADDHRAKYATRLPAGARLLGGPRFALIDPLYASAPKATVHDAVSSIGIFMGGVDAVGATPIVLDACRRHAGFEGPIEVVSTRANPALEPLRTACAAFPGTTLALDLPDLAAFFGRHDLQIGAGGGATWERCCIGAPSLLMAVADNQRYVLAPLEATGAARVFAHERTELALLGEMIRALLNHRDERARLSAAARSLVDGLGARRVVEAIADL